MKTKHWIKKEKKRYLTTNKTKQHSKMRSNERRRRMKKYHTTKYRNENKILVYPYSKHHHSTRIPFTLANLIRLFKMLDTHINNNNNMNVFFFSHHSSTNNSLCFSVCMRFFVSVIVLDFLVLLLFFSRFSLHLICFDVVIIVFC